MATTKNPLTSEPRAWMVAFLLAGLSLGSSWLFLIGAVIFPLWMLSRGNGQRPAWWWPIISLGLLLMPIAFLNRQWTAGQIQPTRTQCEELIAMARGQVFPSPSQREAWAQDLQTGAIDRIAAGLTEITTPDYVSLTLMNLNLEPVVWEGTYFSNKLEGSEPGKTQWLFSDGRVFLSTLLPIPTLDRVAGYLGVEAVVLSQHSGESSATWIGTIDPSIDRFQAIQVNPERGQLLSTVSHLLESPQGPPFDYLFLPRLGSTSGIDLAALVWTIALLFTCLAVWRAMPSRDRMVFCALGLLILLLSQSIHVDHLTAFASFIYGSTLLGNLLISPFHLCVSVLLSALLLQTALTKTIVPHTLLSSIGWVILVGVLYLGGPFLQRDLAFSLVHPLEAFGSAGHFLSYLGVLLFFCLSVGLLELLFPKAPLRHRAVTAAAVISPAVFLGLDWAIPIGSIALVWCLVSFKRWRATRAFLRAGLTVLIFYPTLYRAEQQAEIDYVRHDLLDEITLLSERNHFRISHLLNKLDSMSLGDNVRLEESMVRLAEETGLLRQDIAFSLQLNHPDGKVISTIENHMTLLNIPYLLAPQDRIEIYREKPSATQWMVYRTTHQIDGEPYEFVAVLENDYRNLSLIRKKRWIQTGQSAQSHQPSPYFSYLFDVFDPRGDPIYSEGTPDPLNQTERQLARQKPFFWHRSGSNLTFLFSHADYYYRITHKKTPAKMVLARLLSLFLSAWILFLAASPTRGRRRNLLRQWNRSFALKFAGVIFLCSILPTFTLGYFLLNSIGTNQAKEEMALVKSKITSARNFLQAVDRQTQSSGPSDNIGAITDLLGERRERFEEETGRRFLYLSQIMNLDYSVFKSGVLVHTSQPELFREGILNRRLPYDLARDLTVEHKAHEIHRIPIPGGGYILEAFTPIMTSVSPGAVLAITTVPAWHHQRLRWQEQMEFGVTAILGILFVLANIVVLIARNFLRPVKAITRSAARMSRDIRRRPIRIERQDELQRMVVAFNTMQEKIQWSRQELTRQLSLFDVTLQSMNSGLLGCDANGRIILNNAKIRQLLDLDDRSLPESLDDLINVYPGLAPLRRLLREEEEEEFSFTLGSPGEELEILVKIRVRETQIANDIKTILVFDDVTHVLSANRLKAWTEMARRVAHEIKNPLTPIQLEIEHLNHIYGSDQSDFGEELKDGTRQIKKQIRHLRQIATEFSDYARPLELSRTTIDPTTLIKEVLTPYQRTLNKVRFDVSFESLPPVSLDQRLVRRAIHNLVENAIQAIDRQGKIKVRAFSENEFVVIWVEDDGPGIASDDQNRVFEAYFSTKDHGTGLGLALARKTARLHGGNLIIDTNCQAGTRFVLTLPLTSPGDGHQNRY